MLTQRGTVDRCETTTIGGRTAHVPSAAAVAKSLAPGEHRSRGERWGALLTRCAGGDVAALGALYDETVGWSYPLACQATADPTVAESRAKDFYLQLWQDSAQFRPGTDSAVSWVLQRLGRQLKPDPKGPR